MGGPARPLPLRAGSVCMYVTGRDISRAKLQGVVLRDLALPAVVVEAPCSGYQQASISSGPSCKSVCMIFPATSKPKCKYGTIGNPEPDKLST